MKKSFLFILLLIAAFTSFAQDPAYPTAPPAAQNIVAAEYYVDTDPGFGNGTPISVSAAINISNFSAVINLTGLSNGIHRVYVRTKNAEGRWSLTGFKDFLYDFDPVYNSGPVAAQNINALEYYLDNDPGFGNGTAIAITPGLNINNLPVTVNTAGLTVGTHRLYIRSKNLEGRWSLTNVKDFIVDFDYDYPPSSAAAQNIVAMEYYLDTDPGFGAGTAISITPSTNISNLSVIANTSGLSIGTHRIYIRAKSNEGRWSLTNVKDFIVDNDPSYPTAPVTALNIVAAEYFIDTDPGFGLAINIPVTASTDISNLTIAANTNGLTIGTHRIYIRTKNLEGRWSLTNMKDFIVDNDPAYPTAPVAALNVVAAEYFIDTDPGFGLATNIPVTAATTINNISVVANTNGLTIGTHRIYVRTKNLEGKWSLTNVKDFLVDNDPPYGSAPIAALNITAAEYFLDTDPGFGLATAIPVTPSTNISNLPVAINTTGLANGQHIIYVRTKSQEGKWSQTNSASFYTDLMAVSKDTLSFGNVPINTSSTLNLIVTNNSNTNQTINAVAISAPFSSDFGSVVTLGAGQKDTLHISFAPTALTAYNQTLQVQTSAGNYTVVLNGTGIAQTASWTISPANGHNFGNVTIGSSPAANFTIQNTGNIPVTLSSATVNNAAFVPTFTAGTVIPVNGSILVPVTFTPAIVGPYTGVLKIKSSTTGVDSVTAVVNGSGYNPGAPPVLQFVASSPFNSSTGVNAAAGQIGSYTYKILYKSSNNRAPQAGSPSIGIDLNGDHDFTDLNEGVFSMSKEGTSTDYVTGVVYTYTYTHLANTSNAGYQFFATDDNGNTAVSVNTNYIAGPIITDQQLDLRIFANDISFSKSNPVPNETFTMFAKVTNNTALPATNVPVKFYRDTILMGSDVIPSVAPHSSTTISRTMNFAAEGFFPIKVWIDSSNTLNDINVLNNYAIRPIVVGSPNLPGGINVTTSASVQVCPQLKVLISGNAVYYGTGTDTKVAGAEVTINTGTQIITTTTNSNGDYSFLLTGVVCGGNFTYTVSVTDFTFTSSLLTHTMPMPCPAPNACTPAPSQGGMFGSVSTSPCSNIVGSTGTVNFIVKYRERNLANFWNAFDEIIKDTLKVFQDGVLIETFPAADYTHGPGDQITVPIHIPLSTTAPITISAELKYVYVEYLQIPSSLYHGNHIPMTASGAITFQPVDNKPDLTIQNFAQTGFTAFSFTNANLKCVDAGAHTVKVFDSIPGGSFTLIKTSNFAGQAAGTASLITYSDPTMTAGDHFIKIITDADAVITETDESNNQFTFKINVPESDLVITKLVGNTTALSIGSTVKFTATVKNNGRRTGTFNVGFTVNGVQLGVLKTVALLNENASIQVISDTYTVTNADTDCGVVVEAIADFAPSQVTESDELNNTKNLKLGADLSPFQLPGEVGSAANPAVVRVNTNGQFFPAIRNIGERDVRNVNVRFTLNGNRIGADTISYVKAGIPFASFASFTQMFSTPGTYEIKVLADTANAICENSELNNEGSFFIRVVDSKADFEVLSQYISPSSLNPNLAQNITIVGTVRNTGGKVTTANVLRFMVDDIQLGADVPINPLQPGRDTTVAATVSYSSVIPGVKIMKIVADPANLQDEEREDNNIATRAMIVGDAPDLARSFAGAISFNPSGFSVGDSVLISWIIKNNGTQDGTAWARFLIYDENNVLTGIDSLPFTLASGASTTLSRKMLFSVTEGNVITQIVNSSPMEFDLLNNTDTLHFSTVAKMKSNLTISGNIDMKQGAPSQFPGWIGGKIVLGDYDLTINGSITNFDTAHFVITNGTGRLKFVNNVAENTFPVGTGLYNSNFVKINNTGVADNFSVRVAPYVLLNGNSGDTIRNSYVNRTWFIEEQTPGGSNASVEMFWYPTNELPSFNRNASRVSHYTTAWEFGAAGVAVGDTLGRFSKLQDGYTSFSPFSVSNGPVTAALPLQFLAFTAVPSGNDVQLTWATENESNTSHFDLEWSTDGVHFEKLAEIKANNQSGRQLYKYKHLNPIAQVIYYRLKQVDTDGHYTYSAIAKVNLTKLTSVKLYPNPATSVIQLTNIKFTDIRDIQVLSVDGKMISNWSPNYQLQYNVSALKQGAYFIRILKKDLSVETVPFVKQ